MEQADQRQVSLFNTLIRFLAQHDLTSLDASALLSQYGLPQVDLLVLLGNSSLKVAEAAANAYKRGLARQLMICGGIGHSTRFLEENIKSHPVYENVPVGGRPEADMLRDVLVTHLGISADDVILENQSTNCGDNARQAWQVLAQRQHAPQSILLLQDPVLQRRTKASFAKVWQGTNVLLLSYAAFVPLLTLAGGTLAYADEAHREFCGLDRFLSLVLGEVPRLRNDAQGYGPKGKGFIAAVDVPQEVEAAYESLALAFPRYVR